MGIKTNENSGYFSNGYIVKLNSNGDVSNCIQLPINYEPYVFCDSYKNELYSTISDGGRCNIISFDSNLNVIRQKTYNISGAFKTLRTIDNQFVLAGSYTYFQGDNPQSKYMLSKVSFTDISCIDGELRDLKIGNLPFYSNSLDVSISSLSNCNITDYSINTYNISLSDISLCPEISTGTNDVYYNQNASVIPRFIIYPNPTKDRFSLQAENLQNETLSIELLDHLGQVIRKDEIKPLENQIKIDYDISNLPQGIYLISIKASHNQSFKIIKQ